MQKNNAASLWMLTLSMVIFGSIGVFRRAIPLTSAALACFRGAAGALFLLAAAVVQKKKIFRPAGGRTTALLLLSGALMGLNWLLLFEAYRYTTVATATLCYYMAPTMVILLSPVVFRVKIGWKKGLCAAVSVAGMVLVSGVIGGGAPRSADGVGMLFGLGAAVLYAAVILLNKKFSGVDTYQKTILQLLAAAVVLLPSLLVEKPSLSGFQTAEAVLLLLTVGLVHTGAAYALYFGSMDGLQVQTVALFSYLDPVTALILSALVLKEPVTLLSLSGAVLILGAAVVGELPAKQAAPEAERSERELSQP